MDFMQYYFMTVEFEEFILQPRVEEILREVVNPWFVALSTIAWITIPVVLGWLKFKKLVYPRSFLLNALFIDSSLWIVDCIKMCLYGLPIYFVFFEEFL